MSENHIDLELDEKDIQGLGSADAVAKFFARLGYNTNERVTQKPDALGIAGKLTGRIQHVERLTDNEGLFQVYLFELKSVTVADTKGLARAFRDVSVPFILLVLTTPDYDRLDFVLLDREDGKKKTNAPGSVTVQVRPLTLTVGRRGVGKDELIVPLRVLRRFTWTEKDPFGQFDKLRAAYDIAHWSEPDFNNRALFADHFLRHRLPVDFTEWKEDAKLPFKALQELFVGAREKFVKQKEAVVRKELLEPAFYALGFRFEEGKASGSEENQEDYVLYAKDGKEKLAFCLAYPWDRSLDFRDTRGIDTESPNEVPGTLVVRLLQDEVAPWGIVTNGRTWRLYSQKTHAKATNYYEIDLEEVLTHLLSSKDFGDAFRYFWLFFRAKAFIPEGVEAGEETKQQCFLDRLLEGSESYAKKLGDALKERIFADIFPHLAEGFIRNIDQQEGKHADLSRERLDEIYEGTLVLLYRLLFLLFAESRNLLPVREVRGYWEASLARIKEEVAKKAGKVRGKDQDEAQLKAAYSESSYELYDRLLELFAVIDKGDADRNVPVYNGGLFYTEPPKDNFSTEAEAGRFLSAYKVPDRHLALAIDLMARDIDDKAKDLVFIDYKSLGVRQLGSIYEGLLEFKLHVAKEKLGVKKEKGKEVFESFKKLKEKDQARAEKLGAVIRKGGAFLENDKRERKATGSYYTPDYIVKYIVEHAVGPVLEEKFEALRDGFREAESWHHKSLKAAQQKGEDPRKYERGDAVENKWRNLIEDFFDIKVLDPAMGSGHFLVEVVDYVTDRALAFLRGFGWDPVSAHIDYMRETITKEMEKAGILLDEGRLTPVSLTKRQVLKRCVYGVDLNPMAVELAKVSLWLHCFTLGAPLSFLDHHLRCGNSLIGATEKEVEEARRGQMGLFAGTQMAAAKTAVGGMLTVSKLSDVTTQQVRESQSAYQSALDSLAPHKRLFDLHVSQWFKNAPETKGKGKAKTTYSPATEFLRAEHALEWARDPKKVKLSAAEQDVAAKAQHSADQHCFFHWELEFPEVFFGPKAGTESVIERKADGGFDAVVGNPPYDVLAEKELGFDISALVNYLQCQASLIPAIRGKNNLYKLFICRGKNLLNSQGQFSYIVPMALLGDDQAAGVRRTLLLEATLTAIEAFPQKDDPKRRVFPEAKLSTTIFCCSAQTSDRQFSIRSHPGRLIFAGSPLLLLRASQVKAFDETNLTIPSCSQRDWDLATAILANPNIAKLGDYCVAYQGEVNETTDTKKGYVTRDFKSGPQILRGSTITLYAVREPSQGEAIYLKKDEFVSGKPKSKKVRHHEQKRVAWQESSPQNNFRRIIAAPVAEGEFCNHVINYIPASDCSFSLDLLLSFLNSSILEWYFRLGSTNAHVSHYQVYNLPVPKTLTEDPDDVLHTKLVELSKKLQQVERMRKLATRSERSALSNEGQQLQDKVDNVLAAAFQLTGDQLKYIRRRIGEML